ncbi:MAG: MarR family transcriptional regulator [Xenococcaceae cyanobacterium]
MLLILLANAESEEVEIAQTEIAQKLDIKQSRVSRAIKRLTELRIINKKLIAGKLVGYKFLIEGKN